ncbi:acyl-CoA dehydrogenase family protein [Tomitella biformata]|uniref:acyl-CoA dehydrogenase family protein n=1 Tax=Tomitella biformata TaxID=630403 RepID=UPI0004665A85|nr:acyl-CoA dehydrogenase family protein [Tomitella biformata]
MSAPVSLSAAGTLTEDQRQLAKTVRDVVAKHAGSEAVRAAAESAAGYDETLWSLLCEQVGVAALSIPEEFDGIGVSYLESHLVLEELGRNLVPSPMLGSVVIGAQALLASGNTEACARLLPGVAEGSTALALCWSGAEGVWNATDLAVSFADGVLTGEASYVIGGDTADVLLVAANTPDGPALFEVAGDAAGVTRARTAAMDPTRPLSSVRFDSAATTVLAAGTEVVERALTIASIALSAEQVGAAARLLELTVEYTKQRKQFGRAIGSFQALKHRMADLYVLVETARSMSYAAAQSLSSTDAALAKVYCSEAFQTVAGESIQLHGGIAITWEHDAHLYFKRAHGSAQLFGQPRTHLRALEGAVGLS